MIDRVLDWVERHMLAATLATLALLVLVIVSILASVAHAASLSGGFTLPTQYEDGTPLPAASIKGIRVQVGTCSAPGIFGTSEGEQLVPPPGVTWSLTVPRAFGVFCARAQTETVSGTLSAWTPAAVKTIAEPAPKPPVLTTAGGWAWDLRNGQLRFVGLIEAGKPCQGLAPAAGEDLFAVSAADVKLARGAKVRGRLVAVCEVAS